jgi:hypothetical protein
LEGIGRGTNILCRFCDEPLNNGKLVNEQGGYHQQCADDYEQLCYEDYCNEREKWNAREKEMPYRASMDATRDATQGKYLKDLIHEVDVLRLPLKTILDDKACICWDTDGTLTYYDYEDGFPVRYWTPWNTDDKADYTSLERFISKLCKTTDPDTLHLMKSPVWCACESKKQEQMETACEDITAEVDAFESLLGDIEIEF